MPIPGLTEVATQDLFDILHIPKYTGNQWFVDGEMAASGDGTSPGRAFQTIGEGIAAALAGDAISVMAGEYDEDGLDIALDGVELWAEHGVSLVDTTGGAATLVVSGDDCVVRGLNITQAGQIGFHVTGAQVELTNTMVMASTTAYDIDGAMCTIDISHSSTHSVAAYNLGAANAILDKARAIGAGGATTGFIFQGTADGSVLYSCSSVGNGTASFTIAAGGANITIHGFSTGGGDGKWIDGGTGNTYPDFAFEEDLYNSITFANTAPYDLFTVTGVVLIQHIWGVVTTAIGINKTAASLQLFPAGGAAIQLTSVAGSVLSAMPLNTLISKDAVVGTAISVYDATTPFYAEPVATPNKTFSQFAVGQETADVVTTIRLAVTEGGAEGGTIEWHVQWSPVSSDGWLVAA